MFEIENQKIGPNEKTWLIAEISANHDRNLDQALELVELAAKTGWNALKLQTYTAESLTIDSDHHSMAINPIWGHETLYKLYQSAAMPMEFHQPVFARARALGMVPFTSVYDPKDMAFVEDLDCPVYKIASFEMTFDDLLCEIAKTRKPVIMSTGMANLDEVDHAVEVLAKNNAGPVLLLHCVSAYPTPLNAVNLLSLNTLKQRFGEMVGFSDHTEGSRAALAAAAMGAVAIEKHITNDRTRPGPDHRFSANSGILKEISDGISEIFIARGSDIKEIRPDEVINKNAGRRSAFALHDMPAGHVINKNDFRFIRPGVGIPPNDPNAPLGRTLANAVLKGHPICYEDLIK